MESSYSQQFTISSFLLFITTTYSDKECFVHDLKVTYKHAVEEANKLFQLKPANASQDSVQYYEDMCLSIETYFLHLLHLPICSHLAITYANEDAVLNRKMR